MTSVPISNRFDELENEEISDISDLKEMMKQVLAYLKILVKDNKNLEENYSSLQADHKKLQKDYVSLGKEVDENREWLNSQEQHKRNNYMRVYGVEVNKKLEEKYGHNAAAMMTVHQQVLKPMCAAEGVQKLAHPTDEYYNILANAHVLPEKKKSGGGVGEEGRVPSSPPPIIVRFYSPDVRNFFLRHKYILKQGQLEGVSKNVYLAQDLTRMNHKRQQRLIDSKRFEKVWIIDGRKVKFTMKNDKATYTTKLDNRSADEIIASLVK